MIAIAGAKGGCGKTTTTIGLAEAFARDGTPAVALDADRQLPNLHVEAGVDREPTLAALEPDAPLESVVQTSPRARDAGVVAAASPSARIDVEVALERVDAAAEQSLVDCPSGVGPDVVEPLSAADGVVVVTGDDERSLEAAETTIDLARRLGVPVLGTVANACDGPPATAGSWTGVPILGRIPETGAPLTDDTTREAYAEVVERLRRWNATDRTPPSYDDDLLPTGIDALDRTLGGVAPGTVLALVAPPASRSEHLLYAATAPRGTLYLATERSAANVERAVAATSVETGAPTVRRVDEDVLAETASLLERVPDGATLVVDPIGALERTDRSAYASALNALKERAVETGSVVLLHCLTGPTRPANRTATIHAADVVVELETNDGAALSVTKFRADERLAATVDLEERVVEGALVNGGGESLRADDVTDPAGPDPE